MITFIVPQGDKKLVLSGCGRAPGHQQDDLKVDVSIV